MGWGITVIEGAVFLEAHDWGAIVTKPLYAETEALAEGVYEMIVSETPVLSGALVSDETYEINTDPADPLLVFLYPETAGQLGYWGRVYVQYQEGEPEGLPTYTNEPHQMYFRQETEAIPFIEEWGFNALTGGATDFVAGNF